MNDKVLDKYRQIFWEKKKNKTEEDEKVVSKA